MVSHLLGSRTGRCSLIVSALTALLGGLSSGCDGGGGTSTTGGGTGGTGGTGGGGVECDPGPEETPSTQKLTVDIQNNTAADRYLLMECHECEALRVDKKGDFDYVPQTVSISGKESCGCECPSPGASYGTAYRRIAPGASLSASWDARTLATCTTDVDCGGPTASVTVGAFQPADPGDYRVSWGITEMLLDGCTQVGSSDDFTCTEPAQPDIDPGGGFYPVEITLPASGDVTAEITLQ